MIINQPATIVAIVTTGSAGIQVNNAPYNGLWVTLTSSLGITTTGSVGLQVGNASAAPLWIATTGSIGISITGSAGLQVAAPIYNPLPVYNVAPGTTSSAWVKLGFAPNSTDGALVSTQVAVAQPSYAAASGRFTPAASATDVWVLQGSATKTVKVHTITLTASGSTANQVTQLPVQLFLRSTADSGGVSGSITPAAYDLNDSVATAKCYAYTTNPTSLGTSAAPLKVDYLNIVSSSVGTPITWTFGSQPFRKPIYLRGIAQQLCINLSSSNAPTGFQMAVDVEFTEES